MKYKVQVFVFQRPSLTKFWQEGGNTYNSIEEAMEEVWSYNARGFQARLIDIEGNLINMEGIV